MRTFFFSGHQKAFSFSLRVSLAFFQNSLFSLVGGWLKSLHDNLRISEKPKGFCKCREVPNAKSVEIQPWSLAEEPQSKFRPLLLPLPLIPPVKFRQRGCKRGEIRAEAISFPCYKLKRGYNGCRGILKALARYICGTPGSPTYELLLSKTQPCRSKIIYFPSLSVLFFFSFSFCFTSRLQQQAASPGFLRLFWNNEKQPMRHKRERD